MDWIKIIIELSVVTATICFVFGVSSHRYKGIEKYGHLLYAISGVIFMVHKQDQCPEELPVYFGVLYSSILLYFIHWMLDFFEYKKKVNILMTEKLDGAISVTWDDMFNQRVGHKKTFSFTESKKIFHSEEKLVFESRIKDGESIYYFSDFAKEFHVIEGEITIEFKTGEIETLTKDQKTIIRHYEVHRIKATKCKLLVTCIK